MLLLKDSHEKRSMRSLGSDLKIKNRCHTIHTMTLKEQRGLYVVVIFFKKFFTFLVLLFRSFHVAFLVVLFFFIFFIFLE